MTQVIVLIIQIMVSFFQCFVIGCLIDKINYKLAFMNLGIFIFNFAFIINNIISLSK